MLAPASREYDTQPSRFFRLGAGAGRPSVAISTQTQPCGAIERTRQHSPDVLTRFDALNAMTAQSCDVANQRGCEISIVQTLCWACVRKSFVE